MGFTQRKIGFAAPEFAGSHGWVIRPEYDSDKLADELCSAGFKAFAMDGKVEIHQKMTANQFVTLVGQIDYNYRFSNYEAHLLVTADNY